MNTIFTAFAVEMPVGNEIGEFHIGDFTYRTYGHISTEAVFGELRLALTEGDVPVCDVLTAIEALGAKRVL